MGSVQPSMELILQHGILPRPTQRGFARSYLLRHCIDPLNPRLHRDHRVFPEFSPAETSHLFTAAAAASAATALSLEALKASLFKTAADTSNLPEDNTIENSLPQSPPVPSTIEEIWTAAWAGLENDNNNDRDSSKEKDSHSGGGDVPITTPLLWLQGLRGDARRRLLALSLAALQSAIDKKYLNAAAGEGVCDSILKESSAAAAQAWLGYIPAALEQAIASPPGIGEKSKKNNREQQRQQRQLEEEEISEGVGIDWYAVEERKGVYSSVIRLLQSTHIVTAPLNNLEDKGNTEKVENFSTVSPSLRAAAEASLLSRETSLLSQQQQQQGLITSSNYGTERSSNNNSGNISINGWRASHLGGGTTPSQSQSQIFSLAPSVLQDMAVRVADVVAAAYLEEAAQGTWSPSFPPKVAGVVGGEGGEGSKTPVGLENKSAATSTTNYTIGSLSVSTSAQNNTAEETLSPSLASFSTTSLEASWWPVFAHPRVASTRQLQRFSNRLLLSRWIDTTFYSVVAAYDDRLPLFTLCSPGGMLRVRQAPVRRAAQLAGLTGLRYYVSLILEAVDAAAPTLKMMWERATAAVAWLLTYGLGRGIGLVWKGLKIGVSSAAANGSGSDATSSNTKGRGNNNSVKKSSVKRRTTGESDESSGNAGSGSGSLSLA